MDSTYTPAPFNKIKIVLGKITYSALSFLSQLVPQNIYLKLGQALGRACSPLFSKDSQISRTQLEMCDIEKVSNPAETTRFVFGHVGESIFEIFILGKLLTRNPGLSNVIEEDGAEHVENLKKQKERGALALSGHIGCFELLAAYYSINNIPLSVVGRYPNSPYFGAILEKVRESYKVEAIWRQGRTAAAQILRALRNGRVLAVLIDQDTNLENEFSPFFGIEAASPAMPIKLAVKRNLPIVSSFIVRTGLLKHRVVTRPINYSSEDPDAVRNILDEYNRRLEALIREFPSQWIWWHRRWRRRPGINYQIEPKKLRSTSDYLLWLKER